MKKLMMALALMPLMAAVDVQFDYEENWDGTIALTDVRGKIPEDLVIPSTYDGKMVTVIAAHFLDGEDRQIPLKSLVVSEGVLEIGHERLPIVLGLPRFSFLHPCKGSMRKRLRAGRMSCSGNRLFGGRRLRNMDCDRFRWRLAIRRLSSRTAC